MKEKYVFSFCLACAFMLQGWSKGQLGTAFNEVMLITNSSLEEGSAFMTSYYVGYTIGCVIGGLLFKKIDTPIFLCVLLACNGTSVLVIPWCREYFLMIAAHFLYGFFSGSYDAVDVAVSVEIWGVNFGIFIQIFNLMFSIGGVVATLATKPFISTTVTKHTSSVKFNDSQFDTGNLSKSSNFSSNINVNDDVGEESYNSNLYIATSITAAISFMISVQFFAIFLWRYKVSLISYEVLECEKSENSCTQSFESVMPKWPFKTEVFILCNICFLFCIAIGIDFTFSEFLAVFCMKHFDWTSSEGSYITFCVFLTYMGCRFIAIILVKKFKPVILLGVSFVMTFLGFLGLTASSFVLSSVGLWISASILGLAMANVFPLLVGWTNETFTTVTGKIASLLICSAYFGCLANPPILGFLMHRYSTLMFCYLFIIESIFSISIYSVLVVLSMQRL